MVELIDGDVRATAWATMRDSSAHAPSIFYWQICRCDAGPIALQTWLTEFARGLTYSDYQNAVGVQAGAE